MYKHAFQLCFSFRERKSSFWIAVFIDFQCLSMFFKLSWIIFIDLLLDRNAFLLFSQFFPLIFNYLSMLLIDFHLILHWFQTFVFSFDVFQKFFEYFHWCLMIFDDRHYLHINASVMGIDTIPYLLIFSFRDKKSGFAWDGCLH